MKQIFRTAIGMFLLLSATVIAAGEKPEFLAAFDPGADAIQLEFDNQAAPGCFWKPYAVRDAIAARLEEAGLPVRSSSLWVLEVVTWGAATDDYHCAVLLEMNLRRFSVPAEVPGGRTVRTDLLVWDESEMLTGPKIHMDDRISSAAMGYLENLLGVLGSSGVGQDLPEP